MAGKARVPFVVHRRVIREIDAEALEEAWLRMTPTVTCVTDPSSVANFAVAAASPIVALAHFPISSPARKLSVEKVASTVLARSNGVSSAITSAPAARALPTAPARAAGSEGAMRMPAAPAATRLSTAST